MDLSTSAPSSNSPVLNMPYQLEDAFSGRHFLMPSAVAVLPGQRTFAIAETGAHRVSLLSTSGHFIRALKAPRGSVAYSKMPLYHPMGVAVPDSESVIVADSFNSRIVRLSISDGRPLANATSARTHFGAGLTALRYPKGLAYVSHEWPPFGKLPLLYVADYGNSRICTFAVGHLAPSPGFSLPGPVAAVSNGQLVPLLCFGSGPGNGGGGQMDRPTAIAVGEVGGNLRIFVADTFNDRVQEWIFATATTTFRHIRDLGASGTAAAQFRRPVGVALLPSAHGELVTSRLFVTESAGRRAQVFAADGRALQVITPPHAPGSARAPGAAGPGRLGGVCVAVRGNMDSWRDPHRLILIGRERSQVFVYRYRQHGAEHKQ